MGVGRNWCRAVEVISRLYTLADLFASKHFSTRLDHFYNMWAMLLALSSIAEEL